MTGGGFRLVQFVHPGFEYTSREYVGPRGQRSGVMPWKPGMSVHNRKFMLARGSLFDPATGERDVTGPLCFWGEWEGPSVFWRLPSPGKPLPTIVHAPFRPSTTPVESSEHRPDGVWKKLHLQQLHAGPLPGIARPRAWIDRPVRPVRPRRWKALVFA